MENSVKEQLLERNRKIIQIVIERVKRDCPDAVALIGVCGSFYTGEFYEKSDLDLLIVINDKKAWEIASCFILDDIGYDIYCSSWESLEKMASYDHPLVSHVVDVDLVYCAAEKYRERFERLKQQALAVLQAPLTKEIYDKTEPQLQNAMLKYAKLMLTDDLSLCRYYAANILDGVKNVICLLNHSYFKYGVKDHLREILQMETVPNDFEKNVTHLIHARSMQEIKTAATHIMKSVKQLHVEAGKPFAEKSPIPTSDALTGTYEEIYSNWRNKVHFAVKNNDVHLSLMTAMACQQFYDEMHEEYGTVKINLLKAFDPRDLEGFAAAFDRMMERYRNEYVKLRKACKTLHVVEGL
ncbi:nucleotidyltransferase domain-containing protein [Sporolactobacillus shoreicorticis]|uniref:Nucleotidyltransferase domain-containing protein n=1 Tax=Sporolactobacillus shoreicorticis TaxID=1923877 RepID=A0ABW5S0B8_9BACL|nr:nucleotidyltransferase domain-containing protein [Sporolactobacillus shoreicorticis]MCO7124594.1 nucleotidyltransferase domain-containing protein [Sporolactobacillus shoreicorticis]